MNPYEISSKKFNKKHHPNVDQIWGLSGPIANGYRGSAAFNYYSDLCFPQYSFESQSAAEIACDIANAAFAAGYHKCQADIKKVLGV